MDTEKASVHSTATTESHKVPKATLKLSLCVCIVSVVVLMTTLVGIIVCYLSVTNAQNTVNQITDELRASIFQNCFHEVEKTVNDATTALMLAAKNHNAIAIVNKSDSKSFIGDADLIWDYYTISKMYPAILFNVGLVFFNFGFQFNGKSDVQSTVVIYGPSNMVQVIDASTNFTTMNRLVKGQTASNNGQLIFGNPFQGASRSNSAILQKVPGAPTWTQPVFAPTLKTFLVPFMLTTWKNQIPGTPGPGNPDVAVFITLSISSLDAFLKTVPVTNNGVIALIDGATGNMLAASIPGISQNVNKSTAYPAIGNPNTLVSDSVSYLIASFSTNNTVLDYNDTTDLHWFLLLAIPSNDFDGAIKATTLICVSALGLSIALSWFITPLSEQATKFDFSALKEGILKERSNLAEIGVMQTVFNAMIVKFADAIKANASLKGSFNNATTKSSQVGGSKHKSVI
ncbi:hypothetical protein BCR33DRAFT_718640 [Rhizoclosmatium globosum]|uniref:Uncharacterized protein n=1 Tax=Rhizoclosmatium globosum TaxID=329046 RepID=A0A1Y2C4Q3_9FUNG|nr:hypothetical protein BCR33DRAFT_718640 [Rhizoclosmatium globosum]|eukprot:ORY42008.1 hypothetical protein BCR33DRAFT_718640 [Rhizoclosmatium globosum]